MRFLTDRELDFARERLNGGEPSDAAVQRQLRQNLLLVHHVGYLEDDHGITVNHIVPIFGNSLLSAGVAI